jgi:hypothetical protein
MRICVYSIIILIMAETAFCRDGQVELNQEEQELSHLEELLSAQLAAEIEEMEKKMMADLEKRVEERMIQLDNPF